MIKDWIEQLKKNRAAGAVFAKASPKLMEGFVALNTNQNGNGALDARTREILEEAADLVTEVADIS